MAASPNCWPLDDIAACGDLAAALGVRNSAINNWANRYPDFPAPLRVLSTGPVWSLQQVRAWHDGRTWHPGKHKS
ncbi:hypothetical protein ABT336_11805 [Micromonospora sp. NPDC000207]|uniref:hypothetical protein n=1 Tax=Micromonospora sp. NPDC000207 TaxID=3154246 RepID=UPI003329B1B5